MFNRQENICTFSENKFGIVNYIVYLCKIILNKGAMIIQMPDFNKVHEQAMRMKNCSAHKFTYMGSMWGKGDREGNIYFTKVSKCECGKQDFEYVRMEPCPKNKELNKLYK